MNLLLEKWIPVVRCSGAVERIAGTELTDQVDRDPVVRIAFPRADFRSSVFQFLIGVLQTVICPKDVRAWHSFWLEPPTTSFLEERFKEFSFAFELSPENGPRFMQDFVKLDEDRIPISGLLIDSPGENTIKENKDVFVKRGRVEKLCNSCVAAALYTLQCNAPSGGQGHPVGVRGGGPLSTMLLPGETMPQTLWHCLWLNVLDTSVFNRRLHRFPVPVANSDLFPWLAPTRTSEDKKQPGVLLIECHPLQAYWGMPRRIRLEHAQGNAICDVCGLESAEVYTHYRAKTYGVKYAEGWIHPLTPYRTSKKANEGPLSVKGDARCLTYLNWPSFVFSSNAAGIIPAYVVSTFFERSDELDAEGLPRLWVNGYDMDNMKACCWYEGTMPFIGADLEHQDLLRDAACELVRASEEAAKAVRSAVKGAWFRRPKEARGDFTFLVTEIYQRTEEEFYAALEACARALEKGEAPERISEIIKKWVELLRRTALRIFDDYVLAGQQEAVDMRRLVPARRDLLINLGKLINTYTSAH